MVRILERLRSDYKMNCKLMLVGKGNNEEELKRIVSLGKLSDSVIFAGNVSHAYRLYSAFDVFLLTSLREGLPFVLIEAQANGVPVISSLAVPDDIKLNSNFKLLDIEAGAKKWAYELSLISRKRVLPNKKIDEYSANRMSETVMEEVYES